MPPKVLLRIGLSLLFFGLAVYISTNHWLNSRIFVPLRYPVSLDAHQFKSPLFQINLRETYFVSLDLDYSVDDWDEHNRCTYKNILYPQWCLYKFGSDPAQPRKLYITSEQLDRQGFNSNAVVASPGLYQLEWDTPTVAPCLNPRHPRLSVYTDSSGYSDAVALIQLFCVFLAGTGFALMVPAATAAAHRASGRATAMRMFPELVLRNVIPLAKRSPLPPIHGLPHWGLFSGALLWILIFTFMIFLGPLTSSRGLLVSFRSHEVIAWEKSPWQQTLAVYVRPNGRFFVNDEEVERSSLRAKLLEHLSRRVEWSVYFEGDDDTLYMDDIYAMDTIQGCGAKIIWITPKLREEWRQKELSTRRIP
jgi:biopolymer transport protein ExbD